MAGRTPRRTRVYDCNFNAGERYYKSALDNLDKKYNKRESAEKVLSSRPKLNVDDLLDEDLQFARRRAERAIVDDTFFDGRTATAAKQKQQMKTMAANMEDDIDEEVRASLNRIRANKKMLTLPNDLDLEETISTVKRRARIDLGEKLLDTAGGEDDASMTIRRRALKMVTRASDDYVDPSKLTKWTAIDDSNSGTIRSAAAIRAKETKNRLRNLETEMFEQSEKQLAREARSANLKKFLAESDISTAVAIKDKKTIR